MTLLDLKQLVAEANISLIESGSLPSGWDSRYYKVLSWVESEFSGNYWHREVFSQIHYVSCHLNLRYKARNGQAAQLSQCPFSQFVDIQRRSDIFLWNSICELPHWERQSLSAAEYRLLSLCFGEYNPLHEIAHHELLLRWKELYIDCVESVREHLRSHEKWSKWLCIALHFSSFYLDLYFQREISLDNRGMKSAENNDLKDLISRISMVVENRSVLALIELWLNSVDLDRTVDGIPVVGKPRLGQQHLVSVRTVTELLIQTSI